MVKKYLKIILVNIVVIVLLVEIVSMIYIKSKHLTVIYYERIPTYLDIITDKDKTFKNVLFGKGETLTVDPLAPKNIDTTYSWSTWHPRNRMHRQVYPCFDVTYKFNDLGIRGSLPESNDPNTIFFVGDSYVEGFGLVEDSTVSERIHHQLHKQVLNLGTSGHFGPTQMSLVYAGFAEKFKHKDVYVMFYLQNDFIENNIDNHYKKFKNRYRPYRLLINNDSSQIVYKGSLDSTEYNWAHFNKSVNMEFPIFSPDDNFISKLIKLTYTSRCLQLIKSNLNKVDADKVKPSELDYSVIDLNILEKDIQSIIETASKQNARVTFINLPSQYLLNASLGSKNIATEYQQLETKLKKMADKSNARYISFYDYIIEKKVKMNLLFFPCDFHYSNYGESMLTDFILENYQK